jgi:hypothetical protein
MRMWEGTIMPTSTPSARLEKLTEGSFLFCSPQGNVLLGCPPEILKRILAASLPMPDTVVVPERLHHFHSSQASLEFPLYHFLFVQRGLERKRRFQVMAYPKQCDGLAEMLRVTVLGPTAEEMAKAGTPAALAQEIFQETDHLALKKPGTKSSYTIPEIINFIPIENGTRKIIYPARQLLAELALERKGPATFRITYGEEAYDIDLTVTDEQEPSYAIKQTPFDASAGRFTLQVLGRSNGFDPRDPANGYLFNLNGKVVLWDCPAYMHQQLKRMKLDPKRIDAFVLSHVHEDHIDVTESLRDPLHELYATPEVYYSLLVKLSAVYGCSMEEAKKFHKWHPIDVTKPMDLFGAKITFFHSVHAIPAIGCRIELNVGGKRGLLHLSGDHLSNDALGKMKEGGGVSQRRFDFVKGLVKGDETLVLMDAGGGVIHGDFRDYLTHPGRVAYMHTGLIQDQLPTGKELITSGEVLEVIA